MSDADEQTEQYHRRLRTYELWPIALPQKPQDLAVAGLEYSEVGDKVFCRHCRLELKDWLAGDQPLIEHAKHRPACPYLAKLREAGPDMVEEITQKLITREMFRDAFQTDSDERFVATQETVTSIGGRGGRLVDQRVGPGCKAATGLSQDQQEEMDRLREENERLRAEATCKVCLSNDAEVLFEPCYHYATCVDCAPSLQGCPVCRSEIKNFVRTSL